MTRHRRGMTLLELLLAIGITGLVGLATATMMNALGNGMVEQHDTRASMLRAGMAQARLSAYFTRARCILDVHSDRMVIWLEDGDGDDLIDPTEVRWITWTSSTGNLTISWIVDENNLLEDPYSDPAGTDWWNQLTQLSSQSGLETGELTLVSGLNDWSFSTAPESSDRLRREAAMQRRVIDATCTLSIADTEVTHHLGDSIRLHDPPGGDPA